MEIDVEEEFVYANSSGKRRDGKRTTVKPCSGKKLFKMVALTLGLLCVLLATINISLRVIFNNKLTEEGDQLKKEIGRLNERIKRRPLPQGWREFGNSWYYVSTESKSWVVSRQDCLSRGADLAVINGRDEQIFISGLYASSTFVWIGLSDREMEGNWTWVDGTPLTTPYWYHNEPDGGDQDCVFFYSSISGQLGDWYDDACSSEYNWICEK